MFKILGVDFSLNGTGLAVYTGDDFSVTDVNVFSKKKSENTKIITIPNITEQADRLDWVCEKIKSKLNNINFICMEDHIGSYYNWMDGYAILKHTFRSMGIPYIAVTPSALKKFVISGKADKNQMAYQLRQEFNLDFDFLGECADNIVDASWLAILGAFYYRRYHLNDKITLTKERSATLEQILKGKNNKWVLPSK